MAIDFDAEVLDACEEVFGIACTIAAGGPALPFTGIRTRRPVLVDTGGALPVSSAEEILGVRLSMMPFAPADGHTVTMVGATWEIAEVRPDGQGKADLVLKKV